MFNFLLTIAEHSPPPAAAQVQEDDASALIERAKAGDDEAFSSLVLQYERFVYNTAVRVLSSCRRPADSADDIAQEAFIKAWRSLSSFRGDSSFSTWLYRITVNTARDSISSDTRRNTVSLTHDDDGEITEWDVPVTAGEGVPEDDLLKKERILGVRRAIERLPEEQRQVIVMRDLDELSYQEISEKLGVELGTVKSRINRGRASLREIIENGNFV